MFKKLIKITNFGRLQLNNTKVSKIILYRLDIHDLQVTFYEMLKILR